MAKAKTASELGELSYAEASTELDEIVAFFEGTEVDVDELVSRLERATALVDELEARLVRTKMQVEELSPKLAAAAEQEVAAVDPETGEIVDD